jgi:hypothetical protein
LAKYPEIHVTAENPSLLGFHRRYVESERNRIYINAKIIEGIENNTEESPGGLTFIFLLLATLAHEYGHWVRTLLAPEDDTPETLGYIHARGHAKEGQGESGYVAELALFGGFIQCDCFWNESFQNFRLVDKCNVAHHLPIATIENYWNREQFEPFVLDDPVFNREAFYAAVAGAEENLSAKGTSGGASRRPVIPLCPCTPYVVFADKKATGIASKKPTIDIESSESHLNQFDIELVKLRKKQV